MKKLELNGAELHIDSLAIIEEAAADGLVLYHLTCTVNKQSSPGNIVIAVLCSSLFKDVCELVMQALKVHAGVKNE